MSKQHSSVRAYGLLINHGEIALVRSSNPEHQPPLWWLPGGGIDFGESPEETLAREFAEETGLTIGNPQLLGVTSDLRRRKNGDRIHTVRIIYTVDLVNGELTHEVHGTTDHAAWFDLEALGDVNLADYATWALAQFQSRSSS
jgi:ADP-ribose pyrophosphatase YjhB (NUDIX family)